MVQADHKSHGIRNKNISDRTPVENGSNDSTIIQNPDTQKKVPFILLGSYYDGILWSCATRLTLSRIRINITRLPIKLTEALEKRIRKILPVLDIEFSSSEGIPPTIYMIVKTNMKVFTGLSLTLIERPLHSSYDEHFLRGFFHGLCDINPRGKLQLHIKQHWEETMIDILNQYCIIHKSYHHICYITDKNHPFIEKYVAIAEAEDEELSIFEFDPEIHDLMVDKVSSKDSGSITFRKNDDELIEEIILPEVSDENKIHILTEIIRRNIRCPDILIDVLEKGTNPNLIHEALNTLFQWDAFDHIDEVVKTTENSKIYKIGRYLLDIRYQEGLNIDEIYASTKKVIMDE